jgi:peptidoglycan hydrolase CwlO-like protein
MPWSMILGLLLLCLVFIGIGAAAAYAEEKPPTCPEQLSEVTVQAYNLDNDRDTKERVVAKLQVKVYQLQTQIKQLETQLADLQKAKELPPK